MKNILIHLKIFGLAFAIASSNAILLSGCTTKNNDNIYLDTKKCFLFEKKHIIRRSAL